MGKEMKYASNFIFISIKKGDESYIVGDSYITTQWGSMFWSNQKTHTRCLNKLSALVLSTGATIPSWHVSCTK